MSCLDLLSKSKIEYEDVSACAKSLKIDVDLDTLFDECVFLNVNLEGYKVDATNLINFWCKVFQSDGYRFPNLYQIVSFVLSIPPSNAYCERIFSVVLNLWNNERNRLEVCSVMAEILTFFNYDMNCEEFRKFISMPKQNEILSAVKSNQKYLVKS